MRKRIEGARKDGFKLGLAVLGFFLSACTSTPAAPTTQASYFTVNLAPAFAVKAPGDVQIKAFDELTGEPLPLYSPDGASYRVLSDGGEASAGASPSLSVKLAMPTQAPLVTGVVCSLSGGSTYVAFVDTADATVGKTYDQVAVDAGSTALAEVARPMLTMVGALDTAAASPLASDVLTGLAPMRPGLVSYYQSRLADSVNLLAHVDPSNGEITDSTIIGAVVTANKLTQDVDLVLRNTIVGIARQQSAVVRKVKLDTIVFPGSDLEIATGGTKLVLTDSNKQLTTIDLAPSASSTAAAGS